MKLQQYEIDILELVANGLSTVEIAKVTKYSAHSIESFRARIHAKIGAKNAPHAIAISLRQGIIK